MSDTKNDENVVVYSSIELSEIVSITVTIYQESRY